MDWYMNPNQDWYFVKHKRVDFCLHIYRTFSCLSGKSAYRTMGPLLPSLNLNSFSTFCYILIMLKFGKMYMGVSKNRVVTLVHRWLEQLHFNCYYIHLQLINLSALVGQDLNDNPHWSKESRNHNYFNGQVLLAFIYFAILTNMMYCHVKFSSLTLSSPGFWKLTQAQGVGGWGTYLRLFVQGLAKELYESQ